MIAVRIIPTTETSWGVADEYDITSAESKDILHESIKREMLDRIIKENQYEVADGEQYLLLEDLEREEK